MRVFRSSLAIAAIAVVLVVSADSAAAQLCGETTAPQCDGACPELQACLPSIDGCRCQVTSIPCGFLDAGPGCYGYCPPEFPICNFVEDCFCVAAFTPTPTPTQTPPPTNTPEQTTCVGDCGADGSVTVEEIVRAVNIALGNAAASTCLAADNNADGLVTVEEIVRSVTNALMGCP